ncbi:MAG TPA: DNA methyltransferase [Anaerolineae bacterium]|nr:DNA methyltransferase [Anaerolineae bacterium]
MSATRALTIKHVAVGQLVPMDDNPRQMSEGEMQKLMRSIKEFGFVEPLVVRRADKAVIGGHQRLAAAIALGLRNVPVVYVEVSEEQAKALNLALNKIQGEWDLPKLGELLEELRDLPDLDETLSGFDKQEMDQILADLERQQLPGPYEESFDVAAEMLQAQREAAPTRVNSGDTWQLGRHQLYCGDSLAPGALGGVCGGRKVDLVLTDPPYGIGYRSTLAKRGRRKRAITNDGGEEFESFLARALPTVKAAMKRGAVMYWFAGGGGAEPVLAKALLAISEHFTLLNTLVWDKVDPGLGWRWRRSWEAIIEASVGKPRVWLGGTEVRNVLRLPRAIPQADEHPTPKPVPLLEELIRASAPSSGLVLDPFAGSGPTLIAAERTGRTCYAVELEPRYCDIILARWEALTRMHAERADD